MYQGVAPVPQQVPEPAGGPPLHIVVPAAFAGLVVALRAGRMIKKNMWVLHSSCVDQLAARGRLHVFAAQQISVDSCLHLSAARQARSDRAGLVAS